MSDFSALAAAMEGGDRLAVVALADLQEEIGRDDLAAGLREVHAAGRWPLLFQREWNFLMLEDAVRLADCPPDMHSWIPSSLAEKMSWDVRHDRHFIYFATAVGAVLALADAIDQARRLGEPV